MEEIAEAVGPYTKAIILNSPNNPSGVMYSEEFIAGVVEFCEKRSLYLIMDDTYNRLIFDGRTPTNCYDFANDHNLDSSKLVVINCVSKMYAMTGFRIGWAVGNQELIRAMTNIQSQQTSGPAAPSQWAAVGALNGVQSSHRKPAPDAGEQPQRDGRRAWRRFPGVKVTKPGGTFYCFPDFSAYEKDSQKLSRIPARQGAGGHGAGQGVRHGRPPAAQLLRHHQGDHRGHRAHQVGARSRTRPTSSTWATANW